MYPGWGRRARSGRRGIQRHETTAGPHPGERAVKHVSADRVEHRVELRAFILEADVLKVDHPLCTKTLEEARVA